MVVSVWSWPIIVRISNQLNLLKDVKASNSSKKNTKIKTRKNLIFLQVNPSVANQRVQAAETKMKNYSIMLIALLVSLQK